MVNPLHETINHFRILDRERNDPLIGLFEARLQRSLEKGRHFAQLVIMNMILYFLMANFDQDGANASVTQAPDTVKRHSRKGIELAYCLLLAVPSSNLMLECLRLRVKSLSWNDCSTALESIQALVSYGCNVEQRPILTYTSILGGPAMEGKDYDQ